MLFFVLSGFVLPLGFYRSGRTDIVVRAAAKRWLRLVCLVLLAVLFSYLLFYFGYIATVRRHSSVSRLGSARSAVRIRKASVLHSAVH